MTGDRQSLRRRGFLKATGAAAAASVAGCLGRTEQSEDEARAGSASTAQTSGGTLNLFTESVETFDPIRSVNTQSGEIVQQLFDGLTNYENASATNITNLLASSIEVSSDFTTYTITLKSGATFHDGTSVTASDVAYSWERLAQSPNSSRDWFILDVLGISHDRDSDGNYVPGSLAVRTPDASTVEFDLDQPFYATEEMLAYSAFAVVPEGIVGDIEGYSGQMSYDEFATENPIGAGPFQLDHYYDGVEIVANAFADYHGSGPNVDRLYWMHELGADDRWADINDKDVELFDIPTKYYDPSKVSNTTTDSQGRITGEYGPLDNEETVQYQRVTELSTFYLGMDVRHVPKAARQAIAYLVDQDDVAATTHKNRVRPAYHLTMPNIYPGGSSEYDSHATNNYPYSERTSDLSSAQQVMEDAGYGPDNRVSITFSHYTSESWSDFATELQTKATDAYIDITVEQQTFSELLEQGRQGNHDIYTLGWIIDYPAPENILQLIYPPNTDTANSSPMSYTNWDDLNTQAKQDATDAYETILNNPEPTSTDESNRDSAAVTMEEANWDDVIFLPMFHGVSERFYYNSVDVPIHGPMGPTRQKLNGVTINTDIGPEGSMSPTDPDGDGLYEDVDGDGERDADDARLLFQETDQFSDPAKYDFNGNGEVNVADVQALKNENENQ
ncbi:ABC transporter substrate-binding protein [Halorarius litoreus]|uniref:ABC transporter substrate-binding protein n=1 Tax=Halorarius litoreus TaxID=2962676 RepID=UPI0020CDB336|nr:ABC transporter substrate-binding protein [Halorarius litoreus]